MNQGFPLIFSIRYAISRLLRKGDVNIYYLKESLHNRTPYLVGLGSVITASSNKADTNEKKLIHAAPFCLREKFSGEKLEEEFINERACLNSL